MSKVVQTPGLAKGRIPQGHSLSVTFVDEDVQERGRDTVRTLIVYAEARNSEMGEFLGAKLYHNADPDGPPEVEAGEWPAWAESVMKTRLSMATQL